MNTIRKLSLLLMFMAIFLGQSHAAGNDVYTFERMWPTLHQTWYFVTLHGLAADNDGYVYLGDLGNHCVQKLSTGGHFVNRWGTFGQGENQFYEPERIAMDRSMFIYVTDSGIHRIQKFSPHGEYIKTWGEFGSENGQLNKPHGIAVDTAGYVYVADKHNHRIQKFTNEGEFISKWGTLGGDIGQFNFPIGIAVDDAGNLFVVDSGNHRIQKFDSAGNVLKVWGSYGSNDGQFASPEDIAISRKGVIYVVDTNNHRIQSFTGDGGFIGKWGSKGVTNDQLIKPRGITVDRSGYVYVADPENYALKKFSENGQFIAKWGATGIEKGMFAGPTQSAIHPNERIYVADTGNHRIQVFEPDGFFRAEWGNPNRNQPIISSDEFNIKSDLDKLNYVVSLTSNVADGELLGPTGIAFDSSGNVYVADSIHCIVQKFSSDGAFIKRWGGPFLQIFGNDGNGLFFLPAGMAVDSKDFVYVADTYNHRIQKFTSNGDFVTKWGRQGGGDGQFNYPLGIAIDENDFLYVVDTDNSRIQKFTTDGAFISAWGTLGSGDGQFEKPIGITSDHNGYIYVADSNNHRIQKFTVNGDFVMAIGEPGVSLGRFSYPAGISVDKTGKLYVTDSGNNRIQVFKKFVPTERTSKAVIVAGRKADTDSLWNAAEMCANFAFRSLTYQGFTKETIHYLSSNRNIDLDSNGQPDEVDGTASLLNIEYALTQWALETPVADKLIIYLVDHGGNETFRINDTETLTAERLGKWLDDIQAKRSCEVVLIIDACYSGSFLEPLAGDKRILISSSTSQQVAHFVNQGAVSFSNYFWTHVFNGRDVAQAFIGSKDALTASLSSQQPLLDANGNRTANESEDYERVRGVYIGSGTVYKEGAPTIGSVSEEQTLESLNSADIEAFSVQDDDGRVARVWAVIYPPEYTNKLLEKTVINLPTVELISKGENNYAGTFDGFAIEGTYTIAVYAMDRNSNVSIPRITRFHVTNPMKHKAVLIGGDSKLYSVRKIVENQIQLASKALSTQGYADNDIFILSPVTMENHQTVLPTKDNIEYYIRQCASSTTRDVVVFIIGTGFDKNFFINSNETLSATQLDTLLDELQGQIPGRVILIYDGCRSGSFISSLAAPEGKDRIVITSTGIMNPACFASDGHVSFSNFFWKEVFNGANLFSAYNTARRSVTYIVNQTPMIDGNGNGIGNEADEGSLLFQTVIGSGIMLASDPPVVGEIFPETVLNGEKIAAIWADKVISTKPVEAVWAAIVPPETRVNTADASETVCETGIETIYLKDQGSGRFEKAFEGFVRCGTYSVMVYAATPDGTMSEPVISQVRQTNDIYEDDNSLEKAKVILINDSASQSHMFSVKDDEDWVKFFGVSQATYEISAFNLGTRCNIAIELYREDGKTLIRKEDTPGVPQADELLSWKCDKNGIYYVRLIQVKSEWGEGTEYDLKLSTPIGPLPGKIEGAVMNALTRQLIPGAVTIWTSGSGSAVSQNGLYQMIHTAPGSFVLVSETNGYQPYEKQFEIKEGENITIDIEFCPLSLNKGDLNGDGKLDLTDAAIALKTLSGSSFPYCSLSDVNGDSMIGFEEIIYILKTVVGL